MRYNGRYPPITSLPTSFWEAYAAFLRSEKRRHLDDVLMIEKRLEALKKHLPDPHGGPDDLWVDEADI